jgi:hypothetical protein
MPESESFEEYKKRRLEIVAARLRAAGIVAVDEPDHPQKAGCYGCAAVWNGDGARKSALEHPKFFVDGWRHQIWVIERAV